MEEVDRATLFKLIATDPEVRAIFLEELQKEINKEVMAAIYEVAAKKDEDDAMGN